MKSPTNRSIPRVLLTSLLILAALASLAMPTSAQCSNETDFDIPPLSLWANTLQPFPISSDRLSTFNGFQFPNSSYPIWTDIQTAGGYLLATTPYGGNIYDATTQARKESPQLKYVLEGWLGLRGNPPIPSSSVVSFPQWTAEPPGEVNQMMARGAAQAYGGKIYFAVSGVIGLAVFEFNPATPNSPPVSIYQDYDGFNGDRDSSYGGIDFVEVGGTLYLIAAAKELGAVRAWDISKAATRTCAWESVGGTTSCGGNSPYVGILASRTGAAPISPNAISAVEGANGKAYLAVNWWLARGVEVLELNKVGVSLQATSRGLVASTVQHVSSEIWRRGSTYGLAARERGTAGRLVLYNLSSCVAGSCSSAPLVWSRAMFDQVGGSRVTVAETGARAFLWTGEPTACSGSTEKETLLDVTNFTQSNGVVDLTPRTTAVLTGPGGTGTVNYFRFYYPENVTGSLRQAPLAADFSSDGYLYRAMQSSVDSHLLLDQAPTLAISGPTPAYYGDGNVYTATAAGCTPAGGGWSWDAGIASSVVENGSSATITWTNGTSDTVTVSNTACAGALGTLNVALTDPSPVIQQVRLNGQNLGGSASLTQCTVASFDADVLGRAPLAYSWSIAGENASSSTATFTWQVGAAQPGQRSMNFDLTNSAGSDDFSSSLDVVGLPTLVINGLSTVQNPAGTGNVTATADAPGATEWQWDYRLSGSTGAYTPVPGGGFGSGKAVQLIALPLVEQWEVRVTVRNCLSATTLSSSMPTSVTVSNGTPPPTPSLSVSCPSSTVVGTAVTCTASASNCSASASGWSWNTAGGTGSSSSASVGINWTTTGNKTVVASNSACGSASGNDTVVVNAAGGGGGGGGGGGTALTAAFSVAPVSPGVGSPTTFNAGSSTGSIVRYSWSITQNGQSVADYTGVNISHTFANQGTFQVDLIVASSLSCASPSCLASTSKTVIVGQASSNLAANFTFSPASPTQGQDVVLNGSSSTGDIVEFEWTITRPGGSSEQVSGQSVLYEMTDAGAYSVKLRVASEVGCTATNCSSTITKQVTVLASQVLAANFEVLGGGTPVLGKFFTLDASSSTGAPTSYIWEIDGQEIPGQTLTLRFDELGLVPIKLTVLKGTNSATITKNIEIVGDCEADEFSLCLSGRRFHVEVDWTDFEGNEGVGKAREEGTPDSGLFWFFYPNNVEMLVKVLDGCSITNSYWVSVAATTNVAYTLRVTDVMADLTYVVNNPLGNPAPALLDLGALPTCSISSAVTAAPLLAAWYYPAEEDVAAARRESESARFAEQESVLAAAREWELATQRRQSLVASQQSAGTCVASAETFCFLDNRFEATITWRDQEGASGVGRKAGLETNDSGVFYFFSPNNWESLVKMVNACDFNQHFWLFSAASTDQEFALTVRDTVSGAERTYFNPLKTLAPSVTDIEAFPCGN